MSVHFMDDYMLNKKVVEYLKHCYRYYIMDNPVISDAEFDLLAKELYDRYYEIPVIARSIVDRDSYSAATYLGDYPDFIVDMIEVEDKP